jgi:hypothetical protein
MFVWAKEPSSFSLGIVWSRADEQSLRVKTVKTLLLRTTARMPLACGFSQTNPGSLRCYSLLQVQRMDQPG